MVGLPVDEAEEVGGAEGAAVCIADGVVAGDELAMGGVAEPEGEQAFGVVAEALTEGGFLLKPVLQGGGLLVEPEQEAEAVAAEQFGYGSSQPLCHRGGREQGGEVAGGGVA